MQPLLFLTIVFVLMSLIALLIFVSHLIDPISWYSIMSLSLTDNNIVEAMFDPFSTPSPVLDLILFENDWSIGIWKGIHSSRNPSSHYPDLSYHTPSLIQYTCLSSLFSTRIPRSLGEALSHLKWWQTIIDEMCSFQSNST